MRYENIKELRVKYNQNKEVKNIKNTKNKAVKCGDFKKAFELNERLENIWCNYLKEIDVKNKQNYGKENCNQRGNG